jgi:hypothetical protein
MRKSIGLPGLRKTMTAAAAALCLMAGSAGLRADVTLNEKTKFDGIGSGGWGAMEGTDVVIVSGDRLRQESNSKPTGKFLKHLAGEEGFKSATISRLDRKLMYMVDYKDKSYQEMPFSAFKDMQDQMAAQMSGAPPAQEPPQEAGQKQEPKLKCDPVKLEAKRTGEKETIAGFNAERVLVTGTQNCQNVDTKQTCSVVYTVENWKAPMGATLNELVAFYKKQAEAMGLDMKQIQTMASAGRALMGEGTEGFESVMKELGKVEGYTVRSHIKIEKGGNCGTMDQASGQPGMGEAMKGMGDAFKGMFHKKKSGSSDSADSKGGGKGTSAEGGAAGSGLTKIFGMSNEITSVTSSGAEASAFEPPAGFKKKEMPKMEAPKK